MFDASKTSAMLIDNQDPLTWFTQQAAAVRTLWLRLSSCSDNHSFARSRAR